MQDSVAQQSVNQQNRVFLAQLCGSLFGMGGYLLYDSDAFLPLGYSVFMAFCYLIMAYFGLLLVNRLGQHSPEFGMGVLIGSALVRFIVIGLLMAVGFRQFSEAPLAIVLPFMCVFIAPLILVSFKHRKTH